MPHRLLISSLLLLLALTFLVLPANSGNPGSTATATITDKGGCSFEVTYEWSGFTGTGLDAEIAFGYEEAGGLDVFLAWTFIPDRAGSLGSVSKTFTLSGTPSMHRFFGLGELLKIGKNGARAVRNSRTESDYLDAQACGSAVTVS